MPCSEDGEWTLTPQKQKPPPLIFRNVHRHIMMLITIIMIQRKWYVLKPANPTHKEVNRKQSNPDLISNNLIGLAE